MYKILLVDDEQLELETLRDYVNWGNMGIQVVGTAKNGRDALEKVKELKPDIMITDVKMPIMDGLELSKLVRELYSNVIIVFLSGYDEFKFIKTAIDIDAVGYLLKPIDIKELNTLMIKAKKKYEDEKLTTQSIGELKRKYIKDLLFEKDDYNKQVLSSKFLGLNSVSISSDMDEFTLSIINIDADNSSILTENSQLNIKIYHLIDETLSCLTKSGIAVGIKELQYCIIINTTLDDTTNFELIFKAISENLFKEFNLTSTICTSSKKASVSNLNTLYDLVKSCFDYRFYIGNASIIQYENIEGLTIRNDIIPPVIDKNLLTQISRYDRDASFCLIDELFHFILNYRVAKDIVYLNIFNLLNNISEAITIPSEIFAFDISNKAHLWKMICNKESYEELKIFVTILVNTYIDYLVVEHRDNNQNIVNKVLSIIDTSYDKLITVESLAKEIYLSPNYLRTIFKEKTGETILEYLTNIRILKAIELLKDKSLKIHEISIRVGYENVSYFCSLFHKYKGLTPNEYRKKLL